jgi:hypothetical protein
MASFFNDYALSRFYKNCYAGCVEKDLPKGWLWVVFGDGNKSVESMRKYEEANPGFSYENFYRTMYRNYCRPKHYVDILRKGLAFDDRKTSIIFQTYLTQMVLNAEQKYEGDVAQYYKDLSCLREDEVTGKEWWFVR